MLLKCLRTWTNRRKVSDVIRGMQTYRDLYWRLPANVFLLWSTETAWQKCLLCCNTVVQSCNPTCLVVFVLNKVALPHRHISSPSPPPSLPSASSADDRFDTLICFERIWAAWKRLEMSSPSLQVSPSLSPPPLIYTFIDSNTPLKCFEVFCTSYFLHVS